MGMLRLPLIATVSLMLLGGLHVCQGTAESPGRWTPDLHVGGHGMPMPAAV